MFQLNKAATVASEAWNFVFLGPATSGCFRTGDQRSTRVPEGFCGCVLGGFCVHRWVLQCLLAVLGWAGLWLARNE